MEKQENWDFYICSDQIRFWAKKRRRFWIELNRSFFHARDAERSSLSVWTSDEPKNLLKKNLREWERERERERGTAAEKLWAEDYQMWVASKAKELILQELIRALISFIWLKSRNEKKFSIEQSRNETMIWVGLKKKLIRSNPTDAVIRLEPMPIESQP